MCKRSGIIILMLLLIFGARAQKKLTLIDIDVNSYQLYQQQKWTDLIDLSEMARSQGIDFFYLQVRTGIAYFNLKEYRNAADVFMKAWGKGQQYDWFQEYLYYSLVYAGRADEANKQAALFTPDMQKKIGYKKNKLMRIAYEGGYSYNPKFDELESADLGGDVGAGSSYGVAFVLKNYSFQSFDVSHKFGPGITVFHNFTWLNINRGEQIDWGDHYSFPAKTNQFQYFLNPSFVIGKKTHLSPAFNMNWGKLSYQTGAYVNGVQTFYQAETRFSDYIFSLNGWSHFGNFSPGAEINFANIYDEGFSQYSVWLTYYPWSDTRLYFTPRIYFRSSPDEGFGYNSFGISGGVQIGKVYFTGQYLTGDMKNFIELAGYLVANFPGNSKQKISGSFYFPVGKKYQFVARYIGQQVTEEYLVYENGVNTSSTEYSFTKHTFTGGISWNF